MYVPHTAKLLSMDAKEGMTFRTGGYEEEGDDGGLLFQICKNRAECEGNSNRIYPEMIYRENGGTIREFPNGLFAVSRTPVQQVRIECFGAKCKKGEDDSDAFRLYAEWCKKNRAYLIKLPPKKIRISGTFSFLPEVPDSNEHTNFLPRIIGESGSFPGNASINSEEGTGTLIIDISEPEGQGEPTAEPLFAITGPDKQNGNGLEIRNVSFFCSNNNAFKCAIHIFNGGTDCVIQNVQIRNFKGGGLHLNNTFDLQCSGLP